MLDLHRKTLLRPKTGLALLRRVLAYVALVVSTKTELVYLILAMVAKKWWDKEYAEYYQLLIRYNKLRHMLIMWQGDSLDFKPACPRSLYELQARAMSDYLAILEARALIEDIDLEECVKYDN